MSSDGDFAGPSAWQVNATLAHTAPVSGLSFDPVEEGRLWLADTEGFLASYLYPDMSLFTSSRTCWITNYDEPSWSVTSFRGHGLRPQASSSGVSIATGANLRLYDRGGVLLADIPATSLADVGRPSPAGSAAPAPSVMNVLALDSFDPSGGQTTSRLVAAGALPDIHLLDASRLWSAGGPGGGVLRGSSAAASLLGPGGWARNTGLRSIVTLPVPHVVGALAVAEGRSLIASSLDGPSLTVYDILMRSPAPTARLAGHVGGTLTMDATRNLLLTVGCASPGDSPVYPGPRPGTGTLGTRSAVAPLDATVKVFDLRMGRLLTQITVPGTGRGGGGPIYVKFTPHSVDGSSEASAIVATADGRVFTANPDSGRMLTPLGHVEGTTAAIRRAAMRGEAFVPTPENTRVRISAVTLSPSGGAVALSDASGVVHLLSASPVVSTSMMGYPTMPAQVVAGQELWMEHAEALWSTNPPVDATAGGGAAGPFNDRSLPPPPLGVNPPGGLAAGSKDKVASSFAAAVAQRAKAAGLGQAQVQGFRDLSTVSSLSSPTVLAIGNALNSAEVANDAQYDAVLLAGIGSDVPVAAPGIAALVPTFPYQPWDAVWSLPLETAEASSTADFWGDGKDEGKAPRPRGSPSKSGRGSLPIPFYAPGKERASSFPDGYLETPLVSALRRAMKEVDPALLSLVDRTGSYVNNRTANLRLRPNALIYGGRKGYVNPDPRQKVPSKSTLGLGGDGAGRTRRGRERSGSVDSASTGGSTADLERLMRGEDLEEEEVEDEVEEEEGEDDAASVDTAASFAKGSAPGMAPGTLAPYGPLLKRGRLRVPRVYRRPRLTATRFGFFDTDYAKYARGVAPLSGPNGTHFAYAAFEEVGPNSFVNSALQLLFFMRSLRRRLHSHLCAHPHCTACELRFLFDGMVQSPSLSSDARVIPAHNLVRVLVHSDARKLGLLHPCTLEPGRRMEMYLRMALDRLGKELSGMHEPELPLPPNFAAYAEGGAAGGGGEDKGRAGGGKGAGGAQRKASGGAPGGKGGKGGPPPPSPDTAVPPLDRGMTPEALFGVHLTSTTTCSSGHSESRASDVMVVDMSVAVPNANAVGLASGGPPPAMLTPVGVTAAFPGALGSVGSGYTTAALTPPSTPAPPEFSFTSIVRSSLLSTKRQKAWCEGCKAYVPQSLTKAASAVGPMLCLATNLTSEPWTRELWRTTRTDGRPWMASTMDVGFTGGGGAEGAHASPTVQDASGREGSSAPPPGCARYALVGMLLHVPPAAALKPSSGAGSSGSGGRAGEPVPAPSVASLSPGSLSESAAVVHFHYAAVLRVTPTDGSYAPGPGQGGGSGQWLVFNDFRVTPTSEAEALDMRPAWKRPVVLLYQRLDHDVGQGPAADRFFSHMRALTAGVSGQKVEEADAYVAAVQARVAAGFLFPACFPAPPGVPASFLTTVSMPMAGDALRVPPTVFSMPPSIPHQPMLGLAPTSPALPPDAVPRAGEVLALDAEFVAVSTERARVRPDGSRQLLAQARLMPGRLSVVRDTYPRSGAAPLTPAALAHRVVLDAYVVSGEAVVDHLTRFSGIQPGDLDLESSGHRLHTYKSVYMRLRGMMDAGVKVVGHGLRKDFRELGAVLPPSQAIDTVQLWKMREPGARYLSLRFLASHVLGTDIQGTVHDSNEDAECALALYRAYVELEEEGGTSSIDRLLQSLYTMGVQGMQGSGMGGPPPMGLHPAVYGHPGGMPGLGAYPPHPALAQGRGQPLPGHYMPNMQGGGGYGGSGGGGGRGRGQ